MNDGNEAVHWYSELFSLFSGVSLLAIGFVLWLWRVARQTITRAEADERYAMKNASYLKSEADVRFANRESCAMQHQFLSERFKDLNERISREARETRELIEALHHRKPRRDEDPSGSDFS